jgi:CRISPR-associated protein Csy2
MKYTPDALLILPHLKVQNANAISSPLTWGFPCMTAILGFVHALERKAKPLLEIQFSGVGVVCHNFTPQVSQSRGDKLFCLTRNPLTKEEVPPAICQEARAHIEISLIIQVSGKSCLRNDSQCNELARNIFEIAQTLKLAGGSILPCLSYQKHQPTLIEWPDVHDAQQQKSKKILYSLLPGFSLISREDLLDSRTRELQLVNPEATALDALMEFSSLNYEPLVQKTDINSAEWIRRKKPGWIVPIPIGYKAISKLHAPGVVKGARDNDYPFQFVESIYSLGEWKSPHKFKSVEDIMWNYDSDNVQGLYRCKNKNYLKQQ